VRGISGGGGRGEGEKALSILKKRTERARQKILSAKRGGGSSRNRENQIPLGVPGVGVRWPSRVPPEQKEVGRIDIEESYFLTKGKLSQGKGNRRLADQMLLEKDIPEEEREKGGGGGELTLRKEGAERKRVGRGRRKRLSRVKNRGGGREERMSSGGEGPKRHLRTRRQEEENAVQRRSLVINSE